MCIRDRYETEEPKGECVIVIRGRSVQEMEEEARQSWEAVSLEEHMEHYMSQGMDKKEAMKAVAKDRGVSKRDVYQGLHGNKNRSELSGSRI